MAGCLALPVECASGITPLLEWVQSFSRASPLVTMWSFGLRVLCRMTFPAEALPPGTQLASLVINSYLEKRRAAQVDEAADLYDCWRRNSPEARRGGVPPREIFAEFFWLFEPRGKDVFSDPSFEATQRLCGSYDQSQALFECTEPRFASYEEFLSELEKRCRH